MEILKFTIAAGESKRFEKAGRYIEIIDADQALSVFFYDENGGQSDDAQGVVSGLFVEGRYSAFVVSSVQAQTVTLLLSDGRGGSRRQPGNVSVIDRVSSVCQSLNVSNTGAAFAANVVVAPAANVNGLIVRASICGVQAGAGAYGNGRLVGARVAPTQINTGAESIILNSAVSSVSGQTVSNAIFDTRRQLPPGWGLFYLTEGTAPAPPINNANVSFEIL